MTFEDCDRRLFEREMADVTPLVRRAAKADSRAARRSPSEAQLARRANAEASGQETNFLSDEFVELLPHDQPLAFRRDGIQSGLFDKLSHGRYAIEAQLHLQRRALEQCRRELFAFIRDAHSHQLRSLLIVHGRGREDASPANVLRSYVAKWLAQFDEVQAYCSAQARHGGLGACYVVLRKSERARQLNRERHQQRRG
ncbi:DNA endonuclease SmrA [Halotalea alkalilenta]|nr:DNA endonuclease SmrA [Halotalea alkalilenta]